MIKTYKGMLGDGDEDRIRLKTHKGEIGYRIVKFDLMPNKPGGDNSEFVSKIYKITGQSANATIDFTDGDILGAGYINNHTGASYYNLASVITFDREVFNQDIFITMNDGEGGDDKCNYYLELEQIKLSENQATMSTLQSLRRLALPRN